MNKERLDPLRSRAQKGIETAEAKGGEMGLINSSEKVPKNLAEAEVFERGNDSSKSVSNEAAKRKSAVSDEEKYIIHIRREAMKQRPAKRAEVRPPESLKTESTVFPNESGGTQGSDVAQVREQRARKPHPDAEASGTEDDTSKKSRRQPSKAKKKRDRKRLREFMLGKCEMKLDETAVLSTMFSMLLRISKSLSKIARSAAQLKKENLAGKPAMRIDPPSTSPPPVSQHRPTSVEQVVPVASDSEEVRREVQSLRQELAKVTGNQKAMTDRMLAIRFRGNPVLFPIKQGEKWMTLRKQIKRRFKLKREKWWTLEARESGNEEAKWLKVNPPMWKFDENLEYRVVAEGVKKRSNTDRHRRRTKNPRFRPVSLWGHRDSETGETSCGLGESPLTYRQNRFNWTPDERGIEIIPGSKRTVPNVRKMKKKASRERAKQPTKVDVPVADPSGPVVKPVESCGRVYTWRPQGETEVPRRETPTEDWLPPGGTVSDSSAPQTDGSRCVDVLSRTKVERVVQRERPRESALDERIRAPTEARAQQSEPARCYSERKEGSVQPRREDQGSRIRVPPMPPDPVLDRLREDIEERDKRKIQFKDLSEGKKRTPAKRRKC
jgi:hypothetical protein